MLSSLSLSLDVLWSLQEPMANEQPFLSSSLAVSFPLFVFVACWGDRE
jgi:hypothetical protein